MPKLGSSPCRHAMIAACVAEVLESRTLLSGDARPGDIVDIVWEGRTASMRAGEWIVELGPREEGARGEYRGRESPIEPWLAEALAPLAATGVSFKHYLGLDRVFEIQAPTTMPLTGVRAALRSLPGFRVTEPNIILHGTSAPNDPEYDQQWHLENTIVWQSGQGTQDSDIDAEDAWNYSTGSYSTVVAVLDTGVNYNHTDLTWSRWRNPLEIGGDNIDNDGNTYVDDLYGYDFAGNLGTTLTDRIPLDDHGHGTAIAGIIGAKGNNVFGGTGVAQSITILPVRVGKTPEALSSEPPDVELADVISGVRYVNGLYDLGANIQVMVIANESTLENSSVLSFAIDDSADRNILVIASTGNTNTDLDDPPYNYYPAEYEPDNIIAVAASDTNDNRWVSSTTVGSNFGQLAVDVAAPGVNLFTTDFNPADIAGQSYTSNNERFTNFTGTSAAVPVVAGIAALVFAMKPNYTYAQVRDAIIDAANSDSNSSLVNKVVSDGRINAGRVLAALDPGQDATAWGDFGGMRQNDQFVIRPKPGDSSKTQVRWLNTETSIWETYLEMDNSSSKVLHVYLLAGDDDLKVEAGVQTQIYVAGGRGDDVLNASGDVNITGGISGTDDPEMYLALTPEDPPPPVPANYPVHFVGELGEDTIYGGAANDTLRGDEGADLIRGLAGADNAHAGTENDTVYGGTGNDTLQGAGHNDTINGDAGNDSITGDNSNDHIHAGTGNDIVDAGDGDDTTYGAGNDDTIYGGFGSDSLFGDTGNDWIYARNTDLDWVNGGSGTDRGEKDTTENLWSSIEILL